MAAQANPTLVPTSEVNSSQLVESHETTQVLKNELTQAKVRIATLERNAREFETSAIKLRNELTEITEKMKETVMQAEKQNRQDIENTYGLRTDLTAEQAKTGRLENKLKAAYEIIYELDEENNKTIRQCRKKAKEAADAMAQVKELRERLAQADEYVAALHEEHEQTLRNLVLQQESLRELGEARLKSSRWLSDPDKSELEIQNLKKRLEIATALANSLNKQQQGNLDDLEAKREEHDKTLDALWAKTEEHEKAQDTIAEKEKEIRGLKMKAEGYLEMINDVVEEANHTNAELLHRTEQLERAELGLCGLEQRLKETTKERSNDIETIHQFKAQNQTLLDDMERETLELYLARVKISSLEGELRFMAQACSVQEMNSDELDNARIEIFELESKLEETIKNRDSKVSQLATELDGARITISELQDELETTEMGRDWELEQLTAQLDNALYSIDEWEEGEVYQYQEIEELTIQLDEAKTTINWLEHELGVVRKRWAKDYKERDAAIEKLQELEMKGMAASQDLDEASSTPSNQIDGDDDDDFVMLSDSMSTETETETGTDDDNDDWEIPTSQYSENESKDSQCEDDDHNEWSEPGLSFGKAEKREEEDSWGSGPKDWADESYQSASW